MSEPESVASLSVRAVPASVVRPLRSRVLRPGQPPSALVYEYDDHPLTLHAAAFMGEDVVAVATVHPQAPPDAHRDLIPPEAYAQGASFRLRGMATLPETRGRGAGRAVLERCFEHIEKSGASYLWCYARTGAREFYERMGLVAAGDEFEMPGIGPHFTMWKEVMRNA